MSCSTTSPSRGLATGLLAAVTVLSCASTVRANDRPGWRRGRVHIRDIANAMATIEGSRALNDRFAIKGPKDRRPRAERPPLLPWRTRLPQSLVDIGHHLRAYRSIMDDKGWVRRREVRRTYGRYATRWLDALLTQSSKSGGVPSGVSWNDAFLHADDRMMRALVSGQRVVPKMGAFSKLVAQHGRIRPIHTELRNHIVGNTVGLVLRSGLVPRLTHIYGKTYSFDARAGSILHLKGYHVEGMRFRDGAQPLMVNLIGDTLSKLDTFGKLFELDRELIQRELNEERAILTRIDATLKRIKHPERIKRPIFLVADDGGDLLMLVAQHLMDKAHAPFRHLFAGMEKTTKGIKALKALGSELPFHVVDVADAWGKNEYGSPMLGFAVARQTAYEIEMLGKEESAALDHGFASIAGISELGPKMAESWMGNGSPSSFHQIRDNQPIRLGGLKARKKAVVLGGAGKMGDNIMRGLLRGWQAAGYQVGTYDPAGVPKVPKGVTVYTTEDEALANAEVLVSATGTTTMTPEKLDKLPNHAILVNGASFGEFELPTLLDRSIFPHSRKAELRINGHNYLRFANHWIPTGGTDPHRVCISPSGKEILAIRGGGVVNFPNDIDHPRAGKLIPGRYIQLPIGLFYLGMKQAVEGGPAGIFPLARKPQEDYVKEVYAELNARGESLLEPYW